LAVGLFQYSRNIDEERLGSSTKSAKIFQIATSTEGRVGKGWRSM